MSTRNWQETFHTINTRGAEMFGTLWLQANTDAVGSFRSAQLADELERDYRLRAAVAGTVYRVLCAAIRHPNNLARGKERIAAKVAGAGGGAV